MHSEAIRSNRKQSRAVRSNQERSEPSEPTRSHQKQSGAIRTIRANQKPSEAIISHHKPSEAISGMGRPAAWHTARQSSGRPGGGASSPRERKRSRTASAWRARGVPRRSTYQARSGEIGGEIRGDWWRSGEMRRKHLPSRASEGGDRGKSGEIIPSPSAGHRSRRDRRAPRPDCPPHLPPENTPSTPKPSENTQKPPGALRRHQQASKAIRSHPEPSVMRAHSSGEIAPGSSARLGGSGRCL